MSAGTAAPPAAARPLATRTLDACLACGGRDLRRMPMRYEHRGTFPLVECRACGMRFLSVQPAADALAELYSADYFESDFRCGRSEANAFAGDAFRGENRDLVAGFERLLPNRGALLEVGSAAGWLLAAARDRGWTVRGVELSADAAAHARSLGLDVHHGDLASARLAPDQFDLVYMGDVLEHVPDCRAVLTEVVRVLKPGGFLSLRGPTTTNSMARSAGLAVYGAMGRDLVLHEPPYHLWEFRPGSLRTLFERVGLDVVEARESKIPPHHPHGRKTAIQRLAMAALDTLNAPITAMFGVAGDRIVMVGRKRR
jgi:SAM-dependent methyltransferase